MRDKVWSCSHLLAAMAVIGILGQADYSMANPPNCIGLYYDAEATVSCIPDVTLTPYTLFLIATNVTNEYGISGWEGELSFDAGLYINPSSLHGGMNILAHPYYQVGLGVQDVPLAGNSVILAEFTMIATSAGEVYFGALPNPSILGAGGAVFSHGDNAGVLEEFTYAAGSDSVPVLTIGDPACVPVFQPGVAGNALAYPYMTEAALDPDLPLIPSSIERVDGQASIESTFADVEALIEGTVVAVESPRIIVVTYRGARDHNRVSTRVTIDVTEAFWGINASEIIVEMIDHGEAHGAGPGVLGAPQVGDVVVMAIMPRHGVLTALPGDVLFSSSDGNDVYPYGIGEIRIEARLWGAAVSMESQYASADIVIESELDHMCHGECHDGNRMHRVLSVHKGSPGELVSISGGRCTNVGVLADNRLPVAEPGTRYLCFLHLCADGTYKFTNGNHSNYQLVGNSLLSSRGMYLGRIEDMGAMMGGE